MTYLLQTYPQSAHITSRPYLFLYDVTGDVHSDPVLSLKYALLLVGKDFIGGNQYACANTSKEYLRHHESHLADIKHFQNIGKIHNLINRPAIKDYLNELPNDLRQSIEFISKKSPAAPQSKDDLIKAMQHFENIWAYDMTLDPRIMLVEDYFLMRNHNPYQEGLHARNVDRPDLVTTTLEWASLQENSSKIATMFLYSRIAQHFGKTDPQSMKFTKKFIQELTLGHGEKAAEAFAKSPDTYFIKLLNEDRAAIERNQQQSFLARIFSLCTSRARAINVKDRNALVKSAPKMIEDFWTLNSGKWAKDKMKPRPHPKPAIKAA